MGETTEEDVTFAGLKFMFVEFVRKHGITFAFLALGLYFVWQNLLDKDKQLQNQAKEDRIETQKEIEVLRAGIKECNDYNRLTMEKTINDNTEAMREFTIEIRQMRND
jgi:septal ring factor EnvC (AmiA/AmiB activator)